MKFIIVLLLVWTYGIFAMPEKNEPGTFPGCDVRTYFPIAVQGDRCRWRDEVMVGIVSLDPLTIRCARVEVMCDREDKKAADSSE